MNIRTLVTCAAMLAALPYHSAHADIYKYIDENGVVHFTNVNVVKGKKYQRVQSESRKTPSSAKPASQSVSPLAAVSAVSSTNISSTNIPSAYLDRINSACDRHGVDPALVHALVKVESDYNPLALSQKGAMGLMQLMPQTALDMNVRNTFDPDENIDGGVKYLRYLLDRYEGNLSLALAAYNSGETAVKRWGTVPPFKETQEYVQKIMKLYHGTGKMSDSHQYIIYMGYGEDGAILVTDDPSNHKNKALKKRAVSGL
ncbi:MAG TPA: lytic transglycosylase domain-containing protein [Nitrospirota bacterium]|nr:lytic transglycosylase domain-containing protein [Nitrospirota bacterium]